MADLSVREIQESDIAFLLDYWFGADEQFLRSMGADIKLLPPRENFEAFLKKQILADYPEKHAYATIWTLNNKPIGHCNVNPIQYGSQASMHLHLWQPQNRKKGMGSELVKMSLGFFFKNLKLKTLICEPYALNEGPNRTLAKVGFSFENEYITTPGSINFEQPVKRWHLMREDWENTLV